MKKNNCKRCENCKWYKTKKYYEIYSYSKCKRFPKRIPWEYDEKTKSIICGEFKKRDKKDE